MGSNISRRQRVANTATQLLETMTEQFSAAKERLASRDAEILRLRDALAPFAGIADLVKHTDVRDGEIVYRLPKPGGGYWELGRKHFNAARAALASPAPQDDVIVPRARLRAIHQQAVDYARGPEGQPGYYAQTQALADALALLLGAPTRG